MASGSLSSIRSHARGARATEPGCRANTGAICCRFVEGDVRDQGAVEAAIRDADVINHPAGQVAVTSSVSDPRADFEINALGTLNVGKGARIGGREPTVAFTSTNKVYGCMENVALIERDARYAFRAQYTASLGGVRSVPGRAGAHGDTSSLRRVASRRSALLISPEMSNGTSLAGVAAGTTGSTGNRTGAAQDGRVGT